jgi:hypothetical protein
MHSARNRKPWLRFATAILAAETRMAGVLIAPGHFKFSAYLYLYLD